MSADLPIGGMASFLKALISEGNARVTSEPAPPMDAEARRLLVQSEASARLELAGEAPDFRLDVGDWSAAILYASCRFVVCRDVPAAEIVRVLKTPCPQARSPEVEWSADILLRHLPEVYRQARHLSPGDPLLTELVSLGAEWPLSSVGIPGVVQVDAAPLMAHPVLARLYVDRVIKRSDLGRLSDPATREAVKAALGAHPELAPEVSRHLAVLSSQ